MSKQSLHKTEKKSNSGKRKQTLAVSQESFLERISLPITVLALIGLILLPYTLNIIRIMFFFLIQVLKFLKGQ